jgi:hypothetical protein
MNSPKSGNGIETNLIRKEQASRRTPVDVVERLHNGRVLFAAVCPPLAVGGYAIWVDYALPADDVTIQSPNPLLSQSTSRCAILR